MRQYVDLVKKVLSEGTDKKDRTGVGTRSIFGHQMRFDLSEGFPLVSVKATPLRLVMVELIWYLKGSTNIKYLVDNDCKIWNEWADKDGELGPVYGAQWRNFNGEGIDQLKELIHGLSHNPDSRRHILTAWNPAQIDDMALPPCHAFTQFYVADGKLSCHLYQRSCDVFLGLPFNIACYSALTHILAKQCGYRVGEFVWTGGDVHIYSNHFQQATQILNREPKPLPKLEVPFWLNGVDDLIEDRIKAADFRLTGYDPYAKVFAPVAI